MTYKANGKTVTESFATPAEQHKAERELAAFRRYQKLSRAFIEINAQICRRRRKKTAEAIQKEINREVDTLMKAVVTGRRQTGRLDLEAIETATRAAMHRAGAVLLSHILDEGEPIVSSVTCPCGRQAHFHSGRRRRVLTAVGEAEIERAYYNCRQCGQGQSPRDRELDIVDTDYSPGVRRMMAVVGSETSFDRGRAQMELLAGLTVTRKAVERHAEAIGEDITKHEQVQIQRALQLDLPVVAGPGIPVLYIEMDGTGVPVVSAETEGRKCGPRFRFRKVGYSIAATSEVNCNWRQLDIQTGRRGGTTGSGNVGNQTPICRYKELASVSDVTIMS